MDPKNRLLIAIAVTVLIVGALFTSFGRSLFILRTPSVELPSSGASSSGSDVSSGAQTDTGQYQTVSVTPLTVQSIISNTLTRSENYYCELSVETFWEGGSSTTPVQVWVDGGWTHTRQVLNSGMVRHNLVGNGTLYYWYEGSSQWLSVPADDSSADLSQRVPTYETVLDLDVEDIVSADYELRGDTPCVYVEASYGVGRTARFWVGVDSGLLMAAEEEQDGQLTYRMTAYSLLPCPSDASFSLPDGSDPRQASR